MRLINRRQFLKRSLLAAGGLAVGGTGACRPSPTPGSSDVVGITILHTNDFHGALRPKQVDGGESGGAANLVGLVERKRAAASGPILLLDAGDALQGTFISNSNYGEAVVEVMNAAQVDAMTLGNHEFDWGLDVLQERIAQARFPVLAANIQTVAGRPLPGVKPYVILGADGVRVGVIGLTYHDIKTIVAASAIAGIRSLPPVNAVRRVLPELTEQADVVLVLSHLGLAPDKELARAVPEIPLIVGGHSHVVLRGGERVGETVIVQAGAYGEHLGKLVLHYDRATAQIVSIDTEGETLAVQDAGMPDADVAGIVARWGAEVDKQGQETIGSTAIPLDKGRGSEMALGNLIADAMRTADLGDGKKADIALHNDGGIRADLNAGRITFAEMYAVLPFDNILVGLDLTGEQAKEMLENGISSHGSEVQVSGLRLVYSMNKARGRRVIEVEVGGEPLDRTRTYRVVTINYLSEHPQYEDSFGRGTEVTFGPLCLDAVIDYVRRHSPVQPKVEGRIQRM